MDNVRTTVIFSNTKWPRIDCITTGDKEGKSPFEIAQPWKMEATESSCMNVDQTAERHSKDPQCEKCDGEEKCEEDDFSTVANVTASHATGSHMTTSHMDRNSLAQRFSSGGGSSHLVVGVEEEFNTFPRCDTPCTQREGGSDTGEAHTILPSEGKDGEVKGRCAYGNVEWDEGGGDSHRKSQSSLGGEGEGDEEGDRQTFLHLRGGGGEEEAQGRAGPPSDVIMMSSCSTEEVNLSGNLSEVQQNVENDIMYNADVLRGITDPENSSTHSNPGSGCTEAPIITRDALLVINVPGNIATETGLVIDDLGGEGRHGTGKTIADTPHKMADHACETLMPAQITQGPFEGDNDTGPFSVIGPAICSQAGRQDEEKSSTSQGAAGVGLSPSSIVMVAHGATQTAIPEHFNGRRSGHDTKEIPSSDQVWRPDSLRCGLWLNGKEDDTCQSATKELCFSIITKESLNETHSESGNEDLCPSCPTNSPCESFEYISPAEEKEEQNLIPVGAFWEHQDPTDRSPTGPHHLYAQMETAMSTKITGKILVKTGSFEGEQQTSVINSPENIRECQLTAGTNQHQKGATGVSAFGLVTDWIKTTMDENCYPSLVPSLHTENKLGTEASVLGPAFGYRPAINMMDMIELPRFPQRTDAVVPGPRCITQPITYLHDANNRFTQERFQPSPPPPSASVLSDRMPTAVNTFERIQLSLSDDDCGDEGLGHSPLLTSSVELWKSSRRQLPGTRPGAESHSQRELAEVVDVPEADAVKKIQPQGEDTGKGCFDSINRPCEIPSHISTIPPVSTLPVSQSVPATCRIFQAVLGPSIATDSDDGDVPPAIETFREFEMKQQFNMVIQELKLFFAIGANDPSDSSLSEWGSVMNGPKETGAPGPREGPSEPPMDGLRETSSECRSLRIGDNDEDDGGDYSLKAPGSSPGPGVPPHDPGTCERDQQVPPPDWSQPCLDGEDSMYSVGKHREESRKKHEEEMTWTPSFQFSLSEMQFNQRQTAPQRRLEPLRTCARPIRVGLSKRAKTSHLHRNHPYK